MLGNILFLDILTLCFFVAFAATVVLIVRSLIKKSRGRAVTASRVVRVVIILVAVLDAFVIAGVILILSEFPFERFVKVSLILSGILLEALLVGFLAGWQTWRRFLAWCACAALVGGVALAGFLYSRHISNITLNEYFDYTTYTPFMSGSLVQTLDEPAALRFRPEDDLPRMDGATALYPVYAAFAQATYPDTLASLSGQEVRDKYVSCSTTSFAYYRLIHGRADIIFVGSPSAQQEAEAASQGVDLHYTPIGREAFVFFVHPKNPIRGLTLQQIRDIYSGAVTSWSQLGVDGLGDILAYQRDQGSGSQTALERFVMRDTPLMPAPGKQTINDMGQIIESVSSYQNHRSAIGYSFRFYCTSLMHGFDVKLLEVDGVAPTLENIENGTYPLASYFYAVTRSDADENTLALLDWITGPQGQALVAKTGYTPAEAQ